MIAKRVGREVEVPLFIFIFQAGRRAKQVRKEANELLVAVGKQDEVRVRRLLGVGHSPNAVENATRLEKRGVKKKKKKGKKGRRKRR